MPTIRAVVRHVGYWRGVVHKWSTVYHFSGVATVDWSASDCNSIRTLDDEMCYGPSVRDGGTYEALIYNSVSGGVPVATDTTFDPDDTGVWPGFAGTRWTGEEIDAVVPREVALLVHWSAGLSSSGKTVQLRKWWHAVPDTDVEPGLPDISATPAAGLLTGATALTNCFASHGYTMSSGSGRLAGAATVETYFNNHQMPRGRRRRALVTSSGHYTGPTLTIPSLPPVAD